MLAGKRHRVARLGIATRARRPEMKRETAEPADLDPLAMRERAAHHFQERLHRHVDVIRLQVALTLGEDLDQFGLGHGCCVGPRRSFKNGPACAGPLVLHFLRIAYSALLLSCSRSSAPSLVVPLD